MKVCCPPAPFSPARGGRSFRIVHGHVVFSVGRNFLVINLDKKLPQHGKRECGSNIGKSDALAQS
jgi:hypothetical protein